MNNNLGQDLIKAARCLRRYTLNRITGRPMLMNLEVTKKCNARCGFCDYWKTESEEILEDYVPIVRYFRPVAVTLTGGEPFLRNDLERIVHDISKDRSCEHISLITNGSLVDLSKMRVLFNAGLDNMTFSLDKVGEAHDHGRGLPGNFEHIVGLVKSLTPEERRRINFNTFIESGNLTQVISLLHLAKDLGVRLGIGTYSDMKTGAKKFWVDKDHLSEVSELVDHIMKFKRLYPGIVMNSNFYLSQIVTYFRQGGIGGCKAGQSFVQITPNGHVKACSEMPITSHYSTYPRRPKAMACTKCWFQCRGDSQAPLNFERMSDYLALFSHKKDHALSMPKDVSIGMGEINV